MLKQVQEQLKAREEEPDAEVLLSIGGTRDLQVNPLLAMRLCAQCD
jgi:hypothetical protein